MELSVPISLARKLPVGQTVFVKKDGGDVRAAVALKSPLLESSSRTQGIRLRFEDPLERDRWTFGETVEVHFWMPTDTSGYWVPLTALQGEGDDLWSVLRVEVGKSPQIAERRIVEIVQLEADHALVQGAIEAGDLIVVEGRHRVVAGQRVAASLVESTHVQPGLPGEGG